MVHTPHECVRNLSCAEPRPEFHLERVDSCGQSTVNSQQPHLYFVPAEVGTARVVTSGMRASTVLKPVVPLLEKAALL